MARFRGVLPPGCALPHKTRDYALASVKNLIHSVSAAKLSFERDKCVVLSMVAGRCAQILPGGELHLLKSWPYNDSPRLASGVLAHG